MKKVLLGVLLCIPLIIVAAVLLTTTVISKKTYLPIDGVELNFDEYETELMPAPDNIISVFEAKVFPHLAKNKTVVWSVDNQVSTTPGIKTVEELKNEDGDVSQGSDVATINADTGVITLLGIYGNFRVRVTTVEGNKSASCYVEVVGGSVRGVRINNEISSLKLGGSAPLSAILTPADPNNKNLSWSSSNDKVVKVDKNGIVTAVGQGSADVTVTTDDGSYSDTKNIIVENGDLPHGNVIFLSSETVGLSALTSFNGNIFVKSGTATISGGTLYMNASSSATLDVNGEELYVFNCENGDISFENIDLINSDNEGIVKKGNRLFLKAAYKSIEENGIPSVTYSSSDDNVATISSEGVVTPLKEGTVIFTATSTDGKTCAAEFKIVIPVVSLTLKMNGGDDQRGIAAETVYGNETAINADTKSNTLSIDLIRPKNANLENFIFECSDTSIADFSDGDNPNLLVFNKDAQFDGKKYLTITVTAKYPMYRDFPVSTKYVMTVVDGCNVSDCWQFKEEVGKMENVVLQNDIPLPLSLENTIHLRSDLYGNGYAVYATHDTGHEEGDNWLLYIDESNVLMENVTVRHGIMDTEKDLSQFNGDRWCVVVNSEKDAQHVNVVIRYCILENARNPIEIVGGYDENNAENGYSGTLVKGCILRNSSAGSLLIYMATSYNNAAGVATVEDCVFTHSGCVPICIMTDMMSDINKGYTSTDDMIADGYTFRTLRMEGFVDIYNWVTIDQLQLFSVPETGNQIFDALVGQLPTVIQQELAAPAYNDLKHNINGTDYYHLAIVAMGGYAPIPDNLVVDYEKCGYRRQTVKVAGATELVNTINNLLHLLENPLLLYGYDEGNYSIGPDSDISDLEFKESGELYRNLREGRSTGELAE